MAQTSERVRVLRVIARMNVGGPAHQVSLVAGLLDRTRYETLLVAGRLGRGEAPFDELAARHGARLRTLPSLGPEISPVRDARALVSLVRLIRAFRPDIVHTHTAKAGMLGRTAAILSGVHPRIVHTYHGHVLEGYFGRAKSSLFRLLERRLARRSDRLVVVSRAVADDLVRLRVAPRSMFTVIPPGLDLDSYLELGAGDGSFRAEIGAHDGEMVVASIGRLVPIKRIDILLRAVALASRAGVRLKVAVVGDGESRAGLERLAGQLGLDRTVRFLGFRKDLTRMLADTDVAMLTSDNEGTPISLIEAAAAARPAIATAAGGVPDVVVVATGVVVDRGDVQGLADALARMVRDPEGRARMGAAAREHVRGRYGKTRLLHDMDALYTELLSGRGGGDAAQARASE